MIELNKKDYELVEVQNDRTQCDLCCFGNNGNSYCSPKNWKVIKQQLGDCGDDYYKKIDEEVW